ncbi:hypothetical protein PVAG01_11386 [Phlyctema vagabunda]|uniref:Uncharacterized protein n=1 Tax=Phlyctema vagabunda TaxID=108571 RepID=A0ABR4P272_9HELO
MQGHPAEPIRRKYPWNDIKEMEIARLRHLEHTQAQISRIRSAEQSQLHNRAKRDQEEIDRLRGEVASLNATINLRTQHHYPDQFFQHSNAYQENEYFRSQMSIMNRFVPGGYSHNAAYPGRSQPMAPYSSEGLYVTQPPSMAQHMRNRLSEEMQDHARRAAESTGPVANPAEPARPQAQETAPSYLPHDAAVEPMIVDGEAAADRARSGVPGTWTDRAFDESDSDGMSTKAVYEAPVNGDRGTVAACGDLDNEDMSDDSGTVC